MTTPTPTSTPPSTPPPGKPQAKWWALSALGLAMLVLSFDTTVLNVALPTMAARTGATTGDMQWIVDSYTVVLAAAMLPAGLLGDRFGRRLMLVAGLGVFLAGSVLGSLVDTPAPLIAARTVMGLGAAFVMPLSLSVIPSLFGPEDRQKAVAIASTLVAFGMPLGPIVGGTLLQHFWWGSVFLVNIPLVGATIAACLVLLPETRDPAAPRVRALSTLFAVAGLGALVFGVIEAPARGWGDPLVAAALVAGVALLAGLVARERGTERPMLDLALLGRPGFLWNSVAAALVSLVLTGMVFVLPSYLQTGLGYDAFGTGLRLLPMMAGLMVAARASGRLVARFGPRPVIVAGMAVLAAGAFLGATTGSGDGYGTAASWMPLAGAGFGLAVVPSMNSALGALPRARAGSGSGLIQTLRQTGAAIGVAVLGSVLAAGYRGRLGTGGLSASAAHTARDSVVGAHAVAASLGDRALAASANAAYVHGMDLALAVCGGAALLTAALLAAFLPNPRPASRGGSGTGTGARTNTGAHTAAAPVGEATTTAPAPAGLADPRTDARQ